MSDDCTVHFEKYDMDMDMDMVMLLIAVMVMVKGCCQTPF